MNAAEARGRRVGANLAWVFDSAFATGHTATLPLSRMPTIDDLPNELLYLILECVHEDQAGTTTEVAHREVLHSLASASLVARHWRIPAQSFMWRDLMVSEDFHVLRLLASASLGRHRTNELVALATASCYEPLGQLIEALDGLETLDVDDGYVGNLDDEDWFQVDWLFSTKLKGALVYSQALQATH